MDGRCAAVSSKTCCAPKRARERMLAVAEHYYKFGGAARSTTKTEHSSRHSKKSSRRTTFVANYTGATAIGTRCSRYTSQMAADGVRRALAFVAAPTAPTSSCRQYRENMRPRKPKSALPRRNRQAPRVLQPSRFHRPMIENARALSTRSRRSPKRCSTHLYRTQHSASDGLNCRYEEQLREASRLVAAGLPNSLLNSERGPG